MVALDPDPQDPSRAGSDNLGGSNAESTGSSSNFSCVSSNIALVTKNAISYSWRELRVIAVAACMLVLNAIVD